MSPLIAVEGLGLATSAGPVFSDLTFALEPGELAVVVGPSGSGRSALLLAVSGRLRGVTGTVRLGRSSLRTRPRDLRAHTSLARLSDLVEPEGQLTVAESIVERALIDGVHTADASRAVAEAEAVLGTAFDRRRLVDQLDAYARSLLCVALALVRPSDLVLLDDADRGLDLADQRRLLDALVRLCASGRTVLTTTTEAASVPATATVVSLRPTAPPTEKKKS